MFVISGTLPTNGYPESDLNFTFSLSNITMGLSFVGNPWFVVTS